MTIDTAAPVAANDSYSTAEDTPLVIAAGGVMSNDTDAGSQQLSASLVAGPAHGTLTLDANGGFTYTPAHNYNGTDSFTYKVNDGTADSNIATVALTVTAVNDAPIANRDINGVVMGQTVRADAAHGVLGNDADPDGDALHVTAVNGVAANVGSAVAGEYGSLILRADGSYSYSARPKLGSQVVQDTFTYAVNDGSASSTATLTITVAPRGLEYLIGSAGQPLNGTGASEVLDASLGNQVVNAGGGNDILLAGAGDTLTGGSGRDTFAFFNFGSGSVTITDFQLFTDHLQFDPGVTVTSVTTGPAGLDLHLSSGGDIIFQTAFPLLDWHLVL
jgi:VCBS repeat-containing protein